MCATTNQCPNVLWSWHSNWALVYDREMCRIYGQLSSGKTSAIIEEFCVVDWRQLVYCHQTRFCVSVMVKGKDRDYFRPNHKHDKYSLLMETQKTAKLRNLEINTYNGLLRIIPNIIQRCRAVI